MKLTLTTNDGEILGEYKLDEDINLENCYDWHATNTHRYLVWAGFGEIAYDIAIFDAQGYN